MTTNNADTGKTSQIFLKFPKFLLEEEYSHISFMAKGLYAILLDRRQLSIKNKWIDEYGHYVIMGRIEAGKLLGKNEKTARKYFKELVDNDFIFEKKQGYNKANRLYFKRTGKNYRSVPVVTPGRAESFLPTSNTEYNNTDLNKTEYLHDSSQNHGASKKFIKRLKESIMNTYDIDDYHRAYFDSYSEYFNTEPRAYIETVSKYLEYDFDYDGAYEFFLKYFKEIGTPEEAELSKCTINIIDTVLVRER